MNAYETERELCERAEAELADKRYAAWLKRHAAERVTIADRAPSAAQLAWASATFAAIPEPDPLLSLLTSNA